MENHPITSQLNPGTRGRKSSAMRESVQSEDERRNAATAGLRERYGDDLDAWTPDTGGRVNLSV